MYKNKTDSLVSQLLDSHRLICYFISVRISTIWINLKNNEN